MKIGIISDSHDRIESTNRAIDLIKEKEAEVLIHCGDFCAPFMMAELAKFGKEVHCVFGNTDDRFMTPRKAESLGIKFHGDLAELEFDDRKVLVNHYPENAQAYASTGRYDIVFYGHSHVAKKEKIGNTWLVNPGEIMAWKGAPSFAIYDTRTNDVEIIQYAL